MTDTNLVTLNTPENPLGALLKQGAQNLLMKAVEAELQALLTQYSDDQIDGKNRVVRNGHLPERTIQTGLGDVKVQIPKVRDRKGEGVKFNSQLVPPYLKRTKNIEELVPWLYLRGISTGDMQPALEALLGKEAKGLSANTVCRLKQQWEQDYDLWRKRDLSKRRYVYFWVDGIYSRVRMDDRLCLLVIVASDETGRKELLAVSDGYRESEVSWTEVLLQLQEQGIAHPPKLAVGDGALGFWNALAKFWPETKAQRCWFHKTGNVLNKVPKAIQPKVKEALRDIWMGETREAAETAMKAFKKRFDAKYPKATECLLKDQEKLLAFYDFPAEQWQHIRTTNPVESVFATVRLRTDKIKHCGSRKTTLTMVFKLAQAAENKWQRLRGYRLLADVIVGIPFKDGVRQKQSSQQVAVEAPIHQF